MTKEQLEESVEQIMSLPLRKMDKEDINREQLRKACLLKQVEESCDYITVSCEDIFEFAEKYLYIKRTQVKDYKSVAEAYAKKRIDNNEIKWEIDDLDYLCQYSFSALNQIRQFPYFEKGIKYLEKVYGFSPAMSVKELKLIRKSIK